MSFRRFQLWKLFRFSHRIERPLDVFLERFLSQLGDASRAKLRLAPLVVDELGEHGLRELREVLLEFQSSVAVHLLLGFKAQVSLMRDDERDDDDMMMFFFQLEQKSTKNTTRSSTFCAEEEEEGE